ncbi:MAG: DNA adenine methylase [Parvibaculum sp.]|nr:DNA adenine methylase [Parvibaculum sp.]MDP3328754.1 DNA adenine methylase [Parvibaculum sp.]
MRAATNSTASEIPPPRPVLRWHGGKWILAPWIIAHFPPHRIYVEPFGGAASVLMRKPRSYAEIYNDLDSDVVGLFQVLRNPDLSARLIAGLRLTPFARLEFENAYEVVDDPVESARQLCIRSFMGFGSDGFNRDVRTGFRAQSNRSGTTPAHDWCNYPESLLEVVKRLRGVVVENKDAIEVMRAHDCPTTLHYVDPPYMPETRSEKSRRTGEKYHAYRHEMTSADHVALLEFLGGVDGMVVLSGYPNDMYESMLEGWVRVERAALADGARKRVEVLWINPAAAAFLNRDLFSGSAA